MCPDLSTLTHSLYCIGCSGGVQTRGFSPLIAAAHFGHYRLVKLLIRHGAAVDLANVRAHGVGCNALRVRTCAVD